MVSVGNIAAGGTGKTPFVRWLAGEMLARGLLPSILTRGYAREGRGQVVVSDGQGHWATPERAGDEAWLLARALPSVPVIADAQRVRAAQRVVSLAPAVGLHLLDDGFSHLALDREVDIVLLDATDPAAGGSLLPAGRLREPLTSLGRADLIVVTRTDHADPTEALELARRYAPGAPVYRAASHILGIVDDHGDSVRPVDLPGKTVLAVAGIAKPASFWRTLEELRIEPTERLAFPDHARYGELRVRRILKNAAATGATAVVTTEKDAVKLQNRLPLPLYRVRIETRVEEPGFLDDVLSRLERRPS